MDQSPFNYSKAIIKVLREEEVKAIRNYLGCFDSNFTRANNKNVKLFNLLVEHPDIDWDQARRRVNQTMADDSFVRTCRRLLKKLYQGLILDVNIERKDAYSLRTKVKYRSRKKLMAIEILKSRGLFEEANRLLDSTIAETKSYELYTELVEALRERALSEGLQQRKLARLKTLTEIDIYSAHKKTLALARDWHDGYFATRGSFSGKQEKSFVLMDALSELKRAKEEINSYRVEFYYLGMLVEYLVLAKQYKLGCEVGEKLVDLTSKAIPLKSNEVKGEAILSLGRNRLLTFDFYRSQEDFKQAGKLFSKGSEGYAKAMEFEAKCLVYQMKFQESYEKLHLLIERGNKEKTPVHWARWNYLAAATLFLDGHHKSVRFYLNQATELANDKEGWQLGPKILSILNWVESGKNDFAKEEVAQLEQFLEECEDLNAFTQRELLIVEVLTKLKRSGFDFQATWKIHQDLLAKLESANGKLTWDIHTHEVFPFHKWFESKVRKEEYQFEIPESTIQAAQPTEPFTMEE